MNREKQNALFGEWLESHRGIVIKVARSFATDRDVDDLVQEILLRLWQSAGSFRGDAAASTWIYRVALNRALTWQRNQRTSSDRSLPVAEVADFAQPDTGHSSDRLDELYAALRTFPEVDRTLLLLSLDGFSYAEMAEITGMTITNVGARLSRARRRLSNNLGIQHD